MSKTITLYSCSDPPHTVDKTLTAAGTITGEFVMPLNLDNPVIRVYWEGGSPPNAGATHFSISGLPYTYFVTGMVADLADTYILSGHVDVLYTWREVIHQQSAYIIRAAQSYNNYIADSLLAIDQRRRVQLKQFPIAFDTSNPQYVLVVAGQFSNKPATEEVTTNDETVQTDQPESDNDISVNPEA